MGFRKYVSAYRPTGGCRSVLNRSYGTGLTGIFSRGMGENSGATAYTVVARRHFSRTEQPMLNRSVLLETETALHSYTNLSSAALHLTGWVPTRHGAKQTPHHV